MTASVLQSHLCHQKCSVYLPNILNMYIFVERERHLNSCCPLKRLHRWPHIECFCQSEAFPVLSVWEGVFPNTASVRTRPDSHRREAFWVLAVRKDFQPGKRPEEPSDRSYGRGSLSLRHLCQKLRPAVLLEKTSACISSRYNMLLCGEYGIRGGLQRSWGVLGPKWSGLPSRCLKRSSHKNEILLKIDWLFIGTDLLREERVIHHCLVTGCSAVNGCHQNKSPNSW